MNNRYRITALVLTLLTAGCSTGKIEVKKNHLTVYLWDNTLMNTIVPYIREQIPDADIEFITGNNNVDLYNYMEKYDDLPDIITTRRFSEKDAEALQPFLLDLGAYNIVSEYYPYSLQYCTDNDGAIRWLPVCGIPETMIANKTILDRYEIPVPADYQEFREACKKLHENGIRPYVSELAMDWAAHSLIQGAAIEQFAGIEGIEWRSNMESADENIFLDEMWNTVFTEVRTFMNDTYLTADDLDVTLQQARDMFINGESVIFRGTPAIMEYLKENMDDELIRIPYFSQSSEESWIYTYPSINVALNNTLDEDEDRLDTAMKVLNCFISEEGQKLITDGKGMISYNAHVKSDISGLKGVEKQVENNAFYIRYASNASFKGSYEAVQGMLSGKMNNLDAYEVFKKELNSMPGKEESIIFFQNQYPIEMNNHYEREAASSILTTIRVNSGSDLAFTPFYYYASSIYEGEASETEVRMMIAHNNEAELCSSKLTGKQVKEMVSQYVESVSSPYELPVASGMKLILNEKDAHFVLQDIQKDGRSLENNKEYTILLSNEEDKNTTGMGKAWLDIIKDGRQPCKPEEYLQINKHRT